MQYIYYYQNGRINNKKAEDSVKSGRVGTYAPGEGVVNCPQIFPAEGSSHQIWSL